MTDEKKLVRLNNFMHCVSVTAIVGVLAVFGCLKLSDSSLYIFDIIIDCYTFGFISAFIILSIKLVLHLKKDEWEFHFNSEMLAGALGIVLVCMINGIAEDAKASKVKDILPIDKRIKIVLCEVTEHNNMIDADSSYINVFKVNNNIARKLGVIDEVYFSVKCVEEDMYTYFFDAESGTVTIECSYGWFGDGTVMMNPDYETGKIRYVFKLT
ncbi:MAG: hypothetical protein K2G83_08000 [Ruminococcus sp.]|nr:hypothetical protein [Ruminococcus sp.]